MFKNYLCFLVHHSPLFLFHYSQPVPQKPVSQDTKNPPVLGQKKHRQGREVSHPAASLVLIEGESLVSPPDNRSGNELSAVCM